VTGNSRSEKIVSQITVRKVYSVIRLVLLAFVIAYFISVLFYFFSNDFNLQEDIDNNSTFITYYDINTDSMSNHYRLLTVAYFSMTTLAKIGYGDFSPISNRERLLMIIIMFSGMVFFSYVLEQFIYILQKDPSPTEVLQTVNKQQELIDLQNWII